MTDQSNPSGLSRRNLLAGLAAAPIVTASAEPSLAQTAPTKTAAQKRRLP